MASAKPAFRREPTGTAEGDRAQLLAQEQQRNARLNPLTDARLIDAEANAVPGSGLVFVAGVARSIQHGLGRASVGWIESYATDVPSAAHVGLRATAHPATVSSKTHVTVTPAASGVCYLIIY